MNVFGIYIVGEFGGMGFIKNSVEQGIMAVENIMKKGFEKYGQALDLVIVGVGFVGIFVFFIVKKYGFNFVIFE